MEGSRLESIDDNPTRGARSDAMKITDSSTEHVTPTRLESPPGEASKLAPRRQPERHHRGLARAIEAI